ncbi:Rv3654c family TadE-like protein [Rhodococcus sp. NPDC003318]|uniref:Rv3654c family TadE-like protein n=1 Tax=Rhodococcus sp. NPDC003318 TaxID=3364503 RepID=UPI00367A1ECF
MRRDERGSASVLACFAVLALIALALTVCHLGAAVVARHRAQAAADLGALAAASMATHGLDRACVTARDVTARMGAAVVQCRLEGWDVVLTVTVPVPVAIVADSASASARAGPDEGA